jgi:hypothetical protein
MPSIFSIQRRDVATANQRDYGAIEPPACRGSRTPRQTAPLIVPAQPPSSGLASGVGSWPHDHEPPAGWKSCTTESLRPAMVGPNASEA